MTNSEPVALARFSTNDAEAGHSSLKQILNWEKLSWQGAAEKLEQISLDKDCEVERAIWQEGDFKLLEFKVDSKFENLSVDPLV